MPVSRENLCFKVTFDRCSRMPCIITAPYDNGIAFWREGAMLRFQYGEPVKESDLLEWVISTTHSDAVKQVIRKSNLASILSNLIKAFYQENAARIIIRVADVAEGHYVVTNGLCELDEAALRLKKSPEELQILRENLNPNREEVEAAKDGIVYLK